MIDTAKDAIEIANKWITDHFNNEGVRDVGLEEVKRRDDMWFITIGFSRPWDVSPLAAMAGQKQFRSYKQVVIKSENGEVVEMRDRVAA